MNLPGVVSLGANYLEDGRCRFTLWAPRVKQIKVHLLSPHDRQVTMEPLEQGYHKAVVEGVEPGSLYFYRLEDGKDLPDPASRFQPQGVHGPSQVIDPEAFHWDDSTWKGLPLEQYLLYELHVGTFSPQGTFDGVIPALDELKELGITAIELMPVAQFPGQRNWGYDGVAPYAVQNSYGGPQGLKQLVNNCHRRGLAVVLDVVYNHLGPEGNYLTHYGPYYSSHYQTPWGPAFNFDGPHSDEVRRYFIENALYWVTEFHVDALRLDAIHGIFDMSAYPFLAELGEAVHRRAQELERQIYVIPESDLNDVRVVLPREGGGYGLDAQWNDDFHHALHALLTGERTGYYQDFGRLQDLAKAFEEGFVYSGQYSRFRQRRHGSSSCSVPARRFIVFAQNHDQVGNRAAGDRLSTLLSLEGLKLAAGVVLVSPFIPLLFMGEEYGETAPFQYFISHSDPAVVEAVRQGRRQEFARFHRQGDVPDPQAPATFEACRLHRELRTQGEHRILYEFHREIIRLRRQLPALARLSKGETQVVAFEEEKVLFLRRGFQAPVVAVFNFSNAPAAVPLPVPAGRWRRTLDSAEEMWGGAGSEVPSVLESDGQASFAMNPKAFALFARADRAHS